MTVTSFTDDPKTNIGWKTLRWLEIIYRMEMSWSRLRLLARLRICAKASSSHSSTSHWSKCPIDISFGRLLIIRKAEICFRFKKHDLMNETLRLKIIVSFFLIEVLWISMTKKQFINDCNTYFLFSFHNLPSCLKKWCLLQKCSKVTWK